MEDQTSIQNQEQTTPTNSNGEMAKKEPLIYKKTLVKISMLVLAVFLSIGIVVTGIYAFKTIQEAMKPPEIIEPKPVPQSEPVVEKKPVFAYIKDDTSIWMVDINGEDKIRLLEIPSGSKEKFVSVDWKSENEITYTKFTTNESIIETLDIQTKGIFSELSSQRGMAENLKWGGSNYLAYTLTDQSGKQKFILKTGTVVSPLYSFLTQVENSKLYNRILFSEEGGYVIFAGLRRELPKEETADQVEKIIPFIQIYEFNGTRVDQIDNATDPMVIDKDRIAFKYEGYLSSKYIGQNDITKITEMDGNNPTVSFDKSQYAFWSSTGGFSNALLVVYDTNLNYQRKILRGVLLPEWISSDKVAGIRADNCLGANCQLYQYQTNNLAIVELSIGKVIEVDQGRSISSISYNPWYAN